VARNITFASFYCSSYCFEIFLSRVENQWRSVVLVCMVLAMISRDSDDESWLKEL